MTTKFHAFPLPILKPFAVWLISAVIGLHASAVQASTLTITANDNSAIISNGGAYRSIHVANASHPVIGLINQNITLIGTGADQPLITGASSSVIKVNGVRLALGAATSSPGGFITGDVQLASNGELRIYGNGTSAYALRAGALAGGTVTGNGTLLLRSGANFQCVGIGNSQSPITSATLDPNSSLSVQNGLYTSALALNDAQVSVTGGNAEMGTLTVSGRNSSITAAGNITIGSAQISDSASIEAKTGNLRITDTFSAGTGQTGLVAGGDISISNSSNTASSAGTFSANAGGNITLEKISGNFTVITAGKNALLKGGMLEGQTFSTQDLTLDSSNLSAQLSANNFSANTINQRGDHSAILEVGSIRIPGGVSGNENFIINATGDVTAGSLIAGAIRANNLVITSGGLTLLSRQASTIQGNAQINGAGASTDQGTFTTLAVGGSLEVSGSSLTGGALQAAAVSLGGAGASNLSVSSLQTHSITAAGDASARIAVGSFSPDMAIAAGRNGQIALGASSTTWLSQILQGHQSDNATALGLNSPAELSGAVLMPSASHPQAAANSFIFSPESFLVVNAEAAKETVNPNGILTAAAPSAAKVANGSKLILEGVSANSIYGVLGRNISVAYEGNAAWEGGNLATTSHLIAARKIPGRDGWFQTSQLLAGDIYPDLDPGIHPPLDQGVEEGELGTEFDHYNSRHAGVRFLSRATSTTYMDHDHRGTVKTLESAVRIAVLGAHPQMTLAAANAAMEAGDARAALFSDKDEGRSVSLWLLPLYSSLNTREWPANNFNYDMFGSLGGIAGGCDWITDNALRIGLMASMGGAYAKSGGDLAKTLNRMGFAGIGAYAGVNLKSFGLAANINYTGSWSSLKQELPASMHMADMSGELTGRAFSASLKALTMFPVRENWNLEPYGGIRYSWLVTDNYTIYSNGALLDGNKIEQSIWTFPLGCRLKGEWSTDSGWQIKTDVNVGVIPAADNLSAKTSVRFTGVPGKGEVETQMMDYTVLTSGLGLEASLGPFSLGLRADMKMGRHGEETNIAGLFRYEF